MEIKKEKEDDTPWDVSLQSMVVKEEFKLEEPDDPFMEDNKRLSPVLSVKCPECDKILITQQGLYWHLKNHFKETQKESKSRRKSKKSDDSEQAKQASLNNSEQLDRLDQTKQPNKLKQSDKSEHSGPLKKLEHSIKVEPSEQLDESIRLEKSEQQDNEADPNKDLKYKCKDCGRAFSAVIALTQHLKTHLTKAYTAISCPLCQAVFVRDYDLRRHIKTHSRQKEFPCYICQEVFLYRQSLKNHMKTHQSDEVLIVKREQDVKIESTELPDC
uniref:C2H2-type domain-containing protein n=2 Tax=Lutzomyia longipalpis TaxID=7200 RepID=A0A1B0C7Z9_LUTLO